MKHKLINKQTGEKTLCDKVTIDGFNYYVSDEEFSYNEKVLDIKRNKIETWLHSHTTTSLWFKKVIATNNPNIDIPKVVDEVEMWIDDTTSTLKDDHTIRTSKMCLKAGYNKSQETHPFSEEDIEFLIKKALEDAKKSVIWSEDYYKHLTKELLQLWKEQKPKTVYYE